MTTIMSDVIAGRIELLDPLARGASGSLWRAIDRRYGAICAAKVMRQRDGAEVLRFVREQTVGTAQGLGKHPHLLPPYTWVAEDDTVVLVMPLVHGGTLAGALADHGALAPSLVAHLMRQLLDALAAMHDSSWVHRDVKPANLLLDRTGDAAPHLLLADFGIALHESDVRLTETGLVHGTPGFMAPEVLTGEASSAAQDVWAAAACALEALDPLPPRQRVDVASLPDRAARALAGSADPAAGPLGELLCAMLDADPTRRPAAVQARDAIVPPSAPPAQWSRTATGERFVVADQVEAGHLPEVPLDGPESLAGLAPGLHERITARSAPNPTLSSDPSPSPSPRARHDSTEELMHDPTRRNPQSYLPPHPVQAAPSGPATAQPPSPAARRSGAWIGVLLLVVAALCLAGAAALVAAALM
ncbi:protein kinase [Brachybacterium sp. GCM10030252]|uniref:protein kinase domain-containing protein n=1 Tax=Brachybacterium sp. GCM10030252 TaxID=3273380 RepID=UPI00360DE3C1